VARRRSPLEKSGDGGGGAAAAAAAAVEVAPAEDLLPPSPARRFKNEKNILHFYSRWGKIFQFLSSSVKNFKFFLQAQAQNRIPKIQNLKIQKQC
jgi:hypothetical protein